MSSDLRRELILSAAKRCFARNGFAGTTTKSVAAAASISEGLLFKHFPTKSALYEEILAEACEADPAFERLLQMPPSTEMLVIMVRGMVTHFAQVAGRGDDQECQRLRLLVSSQLDDGEFARLLYGKVGDLIVPVFSAALESAIASGDAVPVGAPARNLFWFAHHAVLMASLGQMPAQHCLSYGSQAAYERQMSEFLLRGLGLTPAAIADHIDRDLPSDLLQLAVADAQPSESA